MVTVYGEDRYADIKIRVLVIDRREPRTVLARSLRLPSTHENPRAFPSIGSLNSSNCLRQQYP